MEQPSLRRSLTLGLVTFYGLGNILGAGIYVLVGKVAGEAGYLAPLSFLVAAIIAALTAFTFAELASRYPLSAGETVYVFEGFGKQQLAILVGLLVIMTGVVSAATIARGFTGYLNVFLPVPGWIAIPALSFALGAIAAWGITASARTAAAFTVLEVLGLVMILVVAAPRLSALPEQLPRFSPGLDLSVWPGIFGGAFLAFYAFVGFEDMVNVAEEVKQPERNLPRAILLAISASTILYVAVALAVLMVLTPELLAATDAPLAEVYTAVTGRTPLTISAIAMFAVVNGALIQIIMASRVCYGMASQGWLPAVFATVNARTRTPLLATVAITLAIVTMALWLPIENLARATSYFLLVIFCLVNLSLWRIKRRQPHASQAPFRVPQWVPAAGFTSALCLLAAETASLLA